MILFLLLALLGFIASVVVHASTFAAVPPLGMREAWPLHIGIFIVFLPMVLSQQHKQKIDAPARAKAGTMDDLLRHAPRWMRQVTLICFSYAIVNFVIFMGSEICASATAKSAPSMDGTSFETTTAPSCGRSASRRSAFMRRVSRAGSRDTG